MDAKLTLTSPIAPAPADGLYVTRCSDMQAAARTITLEIAVTTGADEHPRRFSLTVSDTACGRLTANPHPTFADVLLQDQVTPTDDARLATAFEQVLSAYFSSGMAGVLTTLVTLGLLPVGTVA